MKRSIGRRLLGATRGVKLLGMMLLVWVGMFLAELMGMGDE